MTTEVKTIGLYSFKQEAVYFLHSVAIGVKLFGSGIGQCFKTNNNLPSFHF